jgi:hypothetical protein
MMPLDIAKEYIKNNLPHMEDATLTINEHNPQTDMHLIPHLDGVNENHLSQDVYHVVTAHKDATTEDGNTISSIVKIKVQNDAIQTVLQSK